MKKIIIVALLIFSFVFATNVLAEERVVLATGLSAGTDEKAKDEAVSRALRDAVEKAVGVMVEADTMVKNYKLLEDKIYSRVKGYVKSYEIISENKGDNGTYEVKIRAVVSADILEDDLAGIRVIKSSKGNPRVLVLINEYIDGDESTIDNVRSTMEKEFLGKSFKLIDKTQLTAIKNRDVSVSYEDPEKAAALGARLGAEVVITGTANAEFMEKSKPYGVSVFAYSAQANVKAVKTDTAEVMSVVSADSVKRAGGRKISANEALTECGKRVSDKLIKEIIEKWRSEIYNDMEIALFISNAGSDERTVILKELKGIRGIKEVNEKSYTNNLIEIDLTIEGAAAKVIDKKIMEKLNYLKLKNKTPNRLDFEVSKVPGKASRTKTNDSVIKAVQTSVVKTEEAESH
ncbi:MAG: hypothetical protein KAI43_00630 [Candidatus Aureabacteria bacterium]|nr:hypothetical protein [Candidatus Auribacterota bacterium]